MDVERRPNCSLDAIIAVPCQRRPSAASSADGREPHHRRPVGPLQVRSATRSEGEKRGAGVDADNKLTACDMALAAHVARRGRRREKASQERAGDRRRAPRRGRGVGGSRRRSGLGEEVPLCRPGPAHPGPHPPAGLQEVRPPQRRLPRRRGLRRAGAVGAGRRSGPRRTVRRRQRRGRVPRRAPRNRDLKSSTSACAPGACEVDVVLDHAAKALVLSLAWYSTDQEGDDVAALLDADVARARLPATCSRRSARSSSRWTSSRWRCSRTRSAATRPVRRARDAPDSWTYHDRRSAVAVGSFANVVRADRRPCCRTCCSTTRSTAAPAARCS